VGLNLKNLVLSLAAVAAFSGSALAADLPARTYTKAPLIAEPENHWTGFYIFGGAGGGLWDADQSTVVTGAGTPLSIDQRVGGDGWFGTVGAGYDWQFSNAWVGGIFADGQFGSLHGSLNDTVLAVTGRVKLNDSWAAGARLGYLIAPNVYSYVNAGFTQSYWSGSQLGPVSGAAAVVSTPSFNRSGWFVGGGVENNLNIFGISAPGWFMKTEYRGAYYGRKTLDETIIGGGPLGLSVNFKPFVQTISTSLVYRFNWGGSLVSKY
jgi:outer membrane immunogenic protein